MKVHYFHLDDIIDNDEAKEILYLKKISGFSHDEMISLKDNTETKDESCCVYLMIDTVNNYHKIGISNNPEVRESTLQSEKPSIELIAFKVFQNRDAARTLEKILHQNFEESRRRGEWFQLSSQELVEVKTLLG